MVGTIEDDIRCCEPSDDLQRIRAAVCQISREFLWVTTHPFLTSWLTPDLTINVRDVTFVYQGHRILADVNFDAHLAVTVGVFFTFFNQMT